MRFKIEYSKTKTDRCGHLLPSPIYNTYVDRLEDAKIWARKLSARYKKYDVSIFDMEGPQFGDSSVWCVYGFKAGRCIFTNCNYFEAAK